MTDIAPIAFDRKSRFRGPAFVFSAILLFAISVAPFLFGTSFIIDGRAGLIPILSFVAVGGYAFVEILANARSRPFSLALVHWSFVLIFFALAPLAQHLLNAPPPQADPALYRGPVGMWNTYFLRTNGLLLAWCLSFSIGYHLIARMGRVVDRPPNSGTESNPLVAAFFAIVSLAILAVVLGRNLFALRGGGAADEGVYVGSGFGVFVQTTVRAMPFAAFLILLQTKARSAAYYPVLVFTGLLGFFLVNPLAVSRTLTTAAMLAFVCFFLQKRKISGMWLPIVFCLANFALLPLLNIGRAQTLSEGANQVKISTPIQRLVEGDFDAYMMTIDAQQFVAEEGIRHGYGLASAALFVIPRNAWPDRSVGSGIEIAKHFRFGFTNLSCSLPAEAYLDFGMIGVVAYGMGFGMLLGALDTAFWRRDGGAPKLWYRAAYLQLLGWIFILMRGSLTPILPFTLAVMSAYFVVGGVSRLGIRQRKRPYGLPEI